MRDLEFLQVTKIEVLLPGLLVLSEYFDKYIIG